MSDRALVFGATGALGREIATHFDTNGVDVTHVTRSNTSDPQWVSSSSDSWTAVFPSRHFNRVVFANGANAAGGIGETSADSVSELVDANVLSIIRWVNELKSSQLLAQGCRICIIGSVWGNIARPEKLAYIVSKSAVGGLVRSLAIDLGDEGIAVNAVLPGVVDTPMSRSFLSEQSMSKLVSETPGRQLACTSDIANVCAWITSPEAKGVNGQSIVVDNGWSMARYV